MNITIIFGIRMDKLYLINKNIQNIVKKEIEKKVRWRELIECMEFHELSDNFIEKYESNMNWKLLSRHIYLSENIIEKYRHKVVWKLISRFDRMSLNFIVRWQNLIDIEKLSENISIYISGNIEEIKEDIISLGYENFIQYFLKSSMEINDEIGEFLLEECYKREGLFFEDLMVKIKKMGKLSINVILKKILNLEQYNTKKIKKKVIIEIIKKQKLTIEIVETNKIIVELCANEIFDDGRYTQEEFEKIILVVENKLDFAKLYDEMDYYRCSDDFIKRNIEKIGEKMFDWYRMSLNLLDYAIKKRKSIINFDCGNAYLISKIENFEEKIKIAEQYIENVEKFWKDVSYYQYFTMKFVIENREKLKLKTILKYTKITEEEKEEMEKLKNELYPEFKRIKRI